MKYRNQRGAALVEVAITIPILLALLLGIAEFARAWHIQQVITNAAREGARVAILPSSGSGPNAAISNAVDTRLAGGNVVGATTVVVNTAATGQPDSVTVSYVYTYEIFGKAMSLLSGGAVPASVTLQSTSVMRNE